MGDAGEIEVPVRSAEELRAWVGKHLRLRLPAGAVCLGHESPFEYLRAAYFEPTSDVVVWGPRGGGKTRLAAVATLLDLLHKPGCQVRILGGSMEQSLRVWEHLLPDLERLVPEMLGKSRSRARRVVLSNGSGAAVLTQSQRAVRGQRVQKMRCDEVDQFDPAVWEAVGPTTRSTTDAGGRPVAGVVEALSTRHHAGGVMGEVIERAEQSGTRVVRWCVLDVMERCGAERACEGCGLWDDCGGRAKTLADGFVAIEDLLRMKRRVSQETWRSELLCLGPSREGRVFPAFSEEAHVAAFAAEEVRGLTLSLGVDFGYTAPFVALWIGRGADGVVYVADEYVQSERTVEQNARKIGEHRWATTEIRCDPAGNSRNEQTGESSVRLLRRLGWRVKSKSAPIREGLELLRRLICPAMGGVAARKLVVHPRCRRLIRAMLEYRYPPGGVSEVPEKDGTHDHLVDALRYWVVLDGAGDAVTAKY